MHMQYVNIMFPTKFGISGVFEEWTGASVSHLMCRCIIVTAVALRLRSFFIGISAEIPIGTHTTLEIIVRTKAANCPEETEVKQIPE